MSWNQTIPEAMRGRLAGIEMLSYSLGPLGGQVRAGFVADAWSVRGSIASGGFACVAGVAITASVLRDFDWEIGEAELVLLAGESGSGKSTIAHAIMRNRLPVRAEIADRPADPARHPPADDRDDPPLPEPAQPHIDDRPEFHLERTERPNHRRLQRQHPTPPKFSRATEPYPPLRCKSRGKIGMTRNDGAARED